MIEDKILDLYVLSLKMHLFFSLLGKYQSSSELFPCQSYISFLPFTESRNCRGWKGPLEIIKSSLSAKQAPYSRLHRWVTRQVLNISREGESTASLGSLFQCSATSLWRSSFSHWCRTSCAPVYGRFPLSCPHRPLKRGWPCPFDSHT